MRIINITILVSAVCGTGSVALADEHRQHEVHEHGGGQLNVAVEKGVLTIDLSVPAMNIVGFEHPPKNNDERDKVRRAAELFKDGGRIFGPSPAAQCILSRAEVESALLENAGHHDETKGHDEEEHADFDASYEFNCNEPSQLKALELTLFKLFPGTEHLRTQVITPDGQTAAELSSAGATLKLK